MIRCNRCNSPVVPILPGSEHNACYSYTCPDCFEDEFGFEVHDDGANALSAEERDRVFENLCNLAAMDCYSTAETCELLESFGFDEQYIRGTKYWDDLRAYYEEV